MRLIFDRGELRLIFDHVVSLFVPGRVPEVPDTYGEFQPGDLKDWSRESLDLLIEEGRRRLDAVHAQFEGIRNRSQFVLVTSLAGAGALFGLIDHIVSSVPSGLAWLFGMLMLVLALLVSFATFASTVQLGTVDPVLFSQLKGQERFELARVLARGYAKAVMSSTSAVNARFTLYRDAVWFLVIGIVMGTLAFVLGGNGA